MRMEEVREVMNEELREVRRNLGGGGSRERGVLARVVRRRGSR